METIQSQDYGRHTDKHVSFRGEPIPQIKKSTNFQVADSKSVIDKISKMNAPQASNVTIDSVHFGKYNLEHVKLSTGDIVPVETAIALAENDMLKGYSTGATPRGGRTLRSKPDPRNSEVKGIYQLPRF